MVLTYRDVARYTGRPRAARAVGNVLNQNRSTDVPCHRVIRSDGSAGGYVWGNRKKVEILKKEGIKFIGSKIDLCSIIYRLQ